MKKKPSKNVRETKPDMRREYAFDYRKARPNRFRAGSRRAPWRLY